MAQKKSVIFMKDKTQDPVINLTGFSLLSFQTLKYSTSLRSRLTVSKNVIASIPSFQKTILRV